MDEPLLDFRRPGALRGWAATHDLAPLEQAREGMVLTATGSDPYAMGPAVEVKAPGPLWLVVRLKASESGIGQVFYYQSGPTERDSVRFPVRAGRWEEARVALPPLAAGPWRLRFDPPGGAGSRTILASIRLEPRLALSEPTWSPHQAEFREKGVVASGPLAVGIGERFGALIVRFGGKVLANGYSAPQLGYQRTRADAVRYLAPGESATIAPMARGGMRLTQTVKDAGGAIWTLTQSLTPQKSGALQVDIGVSVSEVRFLVHLPALLLHCDAAERRAIFAGVEYLDPPDTSSSEADLTGPQAERRMPAAHCPTLPLMALCSGGAYVGLLWDEGDAAPLFDSPERLLGTDGHLLGLLFPDGPRQGKNTVPDAGRRLAPGESLRARGVLCAGRGGSVSEAVQDALARWTLPPIPKASGWERTLAAGWLDAAAREKTRWRHAFPGDFPAQPAPDALACMDWLAARTSDRHLAERLKASADAAFSAERLGPGDVGGIGHVRQAAFPLTRGDALAAARDAKARLPGLLARIAADGSVPYQRDPARPDYGRTHFEKTSNGLSAQVLAEALATMALCGDRERLPEALQKLRRLDDRARGTAPRGAQTWEVPLHTPDILAAAHLVSAFSLGYLFSGDERLLAAARHWAFSGASFVYLRPAGEPVGPYATIAVLGATNWEAPNWIGLPVQWCGLVFADALLDLAMLDPKEALWRRLAEGIVASGIAQTWPMGKGSGREGLLPDSFNLLGQVRSDPCINPATLQVPAARLAGVPLATRMALAVGGPFVFAPGRIERHGPRAFTVVPWPGGEYQVLLAGLDAAPTALRVNGKPTPPTRDASTGAVALRLVGKSRIEF